MEIKEITSKEEMLTHYSILTEVYPNLLIDDYSKELDEMIPHNYGQVGVYENEVCIGLTGYWIGTKLWCGKYIELDNVVVASNHRNKGVGKMIFDFMEKKAIKESCTMLALDTYTDNFKAHKFFFGEGYIPRGFHFINILDKSKVR